MLQTVMSSHYRGWDYGLYIPLCVIFLPDQSVPPIISYVSKRSPQWRAEVKTLTQPMPSGHPANALGRRHQLHLSHRFGNEFNDFIFNHMFILFLMLHRCPPTLLATPKLLVYQPQRNKTPTAAPLPASTHLHCSYSRSKLLHSFQKVCTLHK